MVFCFKTVKIRVTLQRPSLMELRSMGVQVAKSSNVYKEFWPMWPTRISTVRWERVDYNNLVLFLVSFLAHPPPEDFYLVKNVGCIYLKKEGKIRRSAVETFCDGFNAHALNIDPTLNDLKGFDFEALCELIKCYFFQFAYWKIFFF